MLGLLGMDKITEMTEMTEETIKETEENMQEKLTGLKRSMNESKADESPDPTTDESIVADPPKVKCLKGLKNRTTPPEVRWYYGGPMSGKTTSIREEFKEDEVYHKDGLGWKGYMQQRVIVIDDFCRITMKLYELIRLLSGVPMNVEYGVGPLGKTKERIQVPMNSPIIIIICPLPPKELFIRGSTTRSFNIYYICSIF